MAMKTCRICGELKDLGEYYMMVGMRDGHRNECKVCNLAEKAARNRENPQPNRDRVHQWQRENKGRLNAYRKERRKEPEVKLRGRAGHLKRTFGISLDDYEMRLAEQGGGCAICGRSPRPDISLHVDHDHGSGLVRGLLCFSCNQALGSLREDPSIIERALMYVATPRRVRGLVEEAASLAGRGPSSLPAG